MALRAKGGVLVAALVVAAGCSSLLVGSKCDDDGSCGGGLLCDPATNLCVERLPAAGDAGTATDPDAGQTPADAAGPGLDAAPAEPPDATALGLDAAGPGLDAAEPGLDAAGPGLDAAEPGLDAAGPGLDAAANLTPTRECGDVGWCQARFPYDAGAWLPFSTVGGYRDDAYGDMEVWVGGPGPKALKWNTKRWLDVSQAMASDCATSGYPISEVTFFNVDDSYVVWAGLSTAGAGAASCGWANVGSDAPSFGSQNYCSGKTVYGAGWLGGYQPVGTGAFTLVGKAGKIYTYSYPTAVATDTPQTDLRSAHFYDDQETWYVGAGGAVRFGPRGTVPTTDAKTRGFPSLAAELYDVQVYPDTLFVGGAGTLYECKREFDIGTIDAPAISLCENALASHPAWTIREFASTSAADVVAVGVDETSPGSPQPLLLVRTAKGQWSQRVPPQAQGGLFGIWRSGDLTVVVGANGTLLSRRGPL